MRRLLIAMFLLLTCSQIPSFAGSVPIDGFTDVKAWASHPDGGLIAIAPDTTHGKPAMHLHFANQGHGWGNARRMITLPPNACGIEFDVWVNSAGKGAQMFLWLFEKDGDGHLAYVKKDGRSLPDFGKGWVHCFVPVSRFRYEARGNGKPEILTTDKLLVGLLGAESDVCVANLAFRLGQSAENVKEARTMNLSIEDGPKGKVAILCDRFPHQPSHADPRVLAADLKSYGYGVTLLKAGDVADPATLNWGNFDCLILPYGSYYPRAAEGIIKAYLQSGGSFVSMGGYALDTPCVPDATGRLVPVDSGETITAQDIADGGSVSPVGLNTRYGKSGDTLGLQPEQIGVFDPTYHLNNAIGFQAAGMQYVVPANLKSKAPVTGYAACSMLGSNHPISPVQWGRHITIANAFDKYGRSVGPVGSIAHNFAGPYAGSSWAFFGVTDTDLFAKSGPMLPYLGSVVDAVTAKVYLHSLTTDLPCYKDGEKVAVSVTLSNQGRRPFSGTVSFTIYDRAGVKVTDLSPITAFLKPGQAPELQAEWRPEKFGSDLYRVVAKLSVGDKVVDAMETGFVASNPKVMAGGMKFNYKDNYFRDGDRPVLFSGTNVTGAMFYSGNENPLVWDRDFARMRENGLSIMRIMHLAPALLDGKPGPLTPNDLPTDKLPLKMERWFDGLIQLAQKNHIVVFLALTEFQPVLSDSDLARMKDFCRMVAARYKDVPGFMVDIRNEPNVRGGMEGPKQQEPINTYWNDFLRDKYKTDDVLRAAWRVSPPEGPFGSIVCKPGTQAWDDMRTCDYDAFSDYLAQKWIAANAAGLREGNPKLPVTVGFLQEYWALNKIRCMDNLDFANMHSYTGIDVLRADMKLFDRRFEGKSLSLGEFGSVQDHNKRVDGADSDTQDWMRYLQTGHYVFGEGGSFIANWCWKDMDDVVFPWGINYPNAGPRKDILKAFRNQSLLFRQVRPVYKSPDTFLVVPTHMFLGGQANQSIKVLYATVNKLLDNRIRFGVIDDEHLDKLPADVAMLVYPIPFSIPDRAYEQLKSFVRKGGMLTITGDLSYDGNRQRTRADRLEDLCGVRFVSEDYHATNWPDAPGPCIRVEPTTAEDLGIGAYSNSLGGGAVLYSPDPLARSMEGNSAFDLGPASEDDRGLVHVFQLVGSDGSYTSVLANPSDAEEVARTDTGFKIAMAPSATSLTRYSKTGNLLSVEAQGPITWQKKTIPMTGHWALISCDGKDITQSREMIVLPFGGGEIDLGTRDNPKSTIRNPQSELVVQTGDVINGKWRVLSESTNLKVKASGPDAFDIRIVAPRSRLKAVADHVVSELMLAE